TNMIFYREYINAFPDAHDMDFFQWAKIGIPVSLFMIVCAYWTLRLMFFRNTRDEVVSRDYFRVKLKSLGAWTYEEKTVAGIFFCTAILWFTRSDIDLGYFTIHGWGGLFGEHAKFIEDSTVAIAAAIVLFLVPSSKPGERIMVWRDAERLPFEVILLFGGGFALAFGFEVSGLSAWMGEALSGLQNVHPVIIVVSIAVLVCVISEFASNVATIQLMIPILIATFGAGTIHPLFFLLPAAMAASLGFMLPIATPPNTIVYGTKFITTKELARAGLVVNISGIFAITLLASLLYYFGYYTV
ncbi:MAG TPA: SLC13 family permease, partial [Bacteroidia bacterium]|nr:SLC13 family permease [Bacteroidia bacterium]